MKTKKRLLDEPCTIASEPCTIASEPCTNTSKRRVLLQKEDLSASQQCNTYKRRRNTATNNHEVHNMSKRRKLPQKSTISSELRNWSEFPSDLLKLIFEKLPAADAVRFTTVCDSWKRAAKSCVSSPTYTPLLKQPPLLILPRKDIPTRRSFFSSAEKKVHSSINTEFPEDIYIVLSSHGWLLMSELYPKPVCKPAKTYLLNPLSGARIDLPRIPTGDRWPTVHKAAISSDPFRNNNFIIVVIVPEGKMKFLKHGAGTTWTDFDCLEDKFGIDEHILFYKDQLYVVSLDRIIIWEFQGESNPAKREFQMSGLKREGFLHVVESEGDILFVKGLSKKKKVNFYIYRFKIKDDAGGLGEWEKVETLMGRALFLGEQQSSMLLSTRSFPTLEDNSIYEVVPYEKYIKVLVHKYDAKNENESDKPVYLSFEVKKYFHDRIWILPNPVIA